MQVMHKNLHLIICHMEAKAGWGQLTDWRNFLWSQRS